MPVYFWFRIALLLLLTPFESSTTHPHAETLLHSQIILTTAFRSGGSPLTDRAEDLSPQATQEQSTHIPKEIQTFDRP